MDTRENERPNVLPRLRGWYAQLLLTSTINSVLQPTTKDGRISLDKARTFLHELDLHSWLDDANKTKGIAPRSSILLDRPVGQHSAATAKPLLNVATKHKRKLQWLRRWRRRWKVGLGALHTRDTLPAAECASKAGLDLHSTPTLIAQGFRPLAHTGSPFDPKRGSI